MRTLLLVVAAVLFALSCTEETITESITTTTTTDNQSVCSTQACTGGLSVCPGKSCTHPNGTCFSVDSSGRGKFGSTTAGTGISISASNVTFVAAKGDGNCWTISSVR